MLLVHVSSIRNGGMGTFWAQKVALAKSMKFRRLMTFQQKVNNKTCKFYPFFK